jgi:AraC-like DNA-binding protein
VTAIAFDYGFNSPTHFGRVFRASSVRRRANIVARKADVAA